MGLIRAAAILAIDKKSTPSLELKCLETKVFNPSGLKMAAA